MNKSKVIISLIHNNDTERLALIRPDINRLADKLKQKVEIELHEINYQPNLKPVPIYIGLLRDLMYWKLKRSWNRYNKINNKFILLDISYFIFKSIKKYFNRHTRTKWLKSCIIELYVTNKHIKAFSNALEQKADFLLVFEDDAVFKKDSTDKVFDLITDLEKNNKTPTYIDLGGGCQFDEPENSNMKPKRDKQFKYYIKPVTNTACCYLINNEQLKLFDYFLTRKPLLRYIGVDWMLNKLFIVQSKIGIISNCRHADPTFFNHGSVTGEFTAWIR